MSKVNVKRLKLFKDFYGSDSREVKLLEKMFLIQNNDYVYDFVNSVLQNIDCMISVAEEAKSYSSNDRSFYSGYRSASLHILEVVNRLIESYSKGVD